MMVGSSEAYRNDPQVVVFCTVVVSSGVPVSSVSHVFAGVSSVFAGVSDVGGVVEDTDVEKVAVIVWAASMLLNV